MLLVWLLHIRSGMYCTVLRDIMMHTQCYTPSQLLYVSVICGTCRQRCPTYLLALNVFQIAAKCTAKQVHRCVCVCAPVPCTHPPSQSMSSLQAFAIKASG